MDFLIAYGSHTGQAESIARQVQEKCVRLGFTPRLYTLEQNEKTFDITQEKIVVIVVSSTGDGDPPENAARFLRRISRKTLSETYLANVNYALLGLGDSNYSTYQGVPRKVDAALQRLGAQKLIYTGEADDATGLEEAVEPWISTLLKKLCELNEIPLEKLKTLEENSAQSVNNISSGVKKIEISQTQMDDSSIAIEPSYINIEAPSYGDGVSLIKGSESVSSDENLRVPIAPVSFLSCSITHHKFDLSSVKWQNGDHVSGSIGTPQKARIAGTGIASSFDVHKPKHELIVEFSDGVPLYEPGDALYFVVPNPLQEVELLLHRMGFLHMADNELKISVKSDTEKVGASIPSYVPAVCSLRYVFTFCVDIRRTPTRAVLRILAEATDDEFERRRLLELCSAQGMNEFTNFIRKPALSLVDVLIAFPHVSPSAERLIEVLPRLVPRPYSYSTARQRNEKRARFIFSEFSFDANDGRRYKRTGTATEFLISLKVGDEVTVIPKESARFRFPLLTESWEKAIEVPLLLIGPGTGVATFLAFFDRLLHHKICVGSVPNVYRKLFFGFRNAKKDFIYKNELESYVREQILSELVTVESQPDSGENGKYVQDELRQRAHEVFEFLDSPSSRVYICGDAQGMSKDVNACLIEIVASQKGVSTKEAIEYIGNLKKAERIIEDVWA